MSTNRNNTLEVIVVTLENIVEKFKDFSFDEDLNGNNGKEYLSNKAKENGFLSELDYILDKASKQLEGVNQVQKFCNMVLLELPDHYYGSDIIVTPVGDQYVISFMQLMEY
jgi:hypothetical protein